MTKLPVIAAFNGTSNLKFRGFLKACNRLAAAYSCRQLNNYLQKTPPTVINLLSMEAREGKSFLSKYFAEYWETEGLRVRIVQHIILIFEPDTQQYVNAQQLSDFWALNEAEETPNIILVEYPAVNTASIPLPVLQKADVNLLIANACRLWRNSDSVTLAHIMEGMGNVPIFLYLNNAEREVVESFTGELPPQTPLTFTIQSISKLGLTSKKGCCEIAIYKK